MIASAKSAVLLSLLVGVASCATTSVEPTWDAPRIVPPGWTTDYDYTTSVWSYLRYQFDIALVEGASAYIYIYNDHNPHCVQIRELVASGQIASAFEDVRITMLNYNRLKWLHVKKMHAAFDPGDWQPAIVKIGSNGGLTKAVLFPDIHLFHPALLKRARAWPPPRPLTPAGFAKKLKAFFQSNNEI